MNRIILTPLPNTGLSVRTVESETDQLIMEGVRRGFYEGELEIDGVIRETFSVMVDGDITKNITLTPSPVFTWRQSSTIETIPFTTTRKNDDTLDLDTEVVQTEGVDGQVRVTIESEYVNGEPTGKERELYRETVKAMVPQVIRVGTKRTTRLTHKVVSGDTLWSISRKYGVAIDLLRTWNDLKTDTLSIGQILYVEGG